MGSTGVGAAGGVGVASGVGGDVGVGVLAGADGLLGFGAAVGGVSSPHAAMATMATDAIRTVTLVQNFGFLDMLTALSPHPPCGAGACRLS